MGETVELTTVLKTKGVIIWSCLAKGANALLFLRQKPQLPPFTECCNTHLFSLPFLEHVSQDK